MVNFVNDTFTDTNGTLLTNHTGETGATWTTHPASAGGPFEITGNRLEFISGSGDGHVMASGQPTTADYSIEVEFHKVTGNLQQYVLGRMDDTAYSGYMCGYSISSGAYKLWRFDAGSATELGAYSTTLADGSSGTVKVTFSGDAITVDIDGTERISVTDATYSSAGRVGIRASDPGSGSGGIHLDNLLVADQSTGSSVTFDAISLQDNITTGTARSLTFAHTASGTDRIVYVAVAGDGDNYFGTFESVTYGGVSLGTPVISTKLDGGRIVEIFEHINPPATTENVVITFDNSGSAQDMVGAAISYTGVNQSTPRRSAVKAAGDGVTSISLNPASSTGDKVLNFLNLNNAGTDADGTPTSGQVQRGFHNVDGGGGTGLFVADVDGTDTSTALDWTITSQLYGHIGIALRPIGVVITSAPTTVASGATGVSISVEDSATITNAYYAGIDLSASLAVVNATTVTVDFPTYFANGLDFKSHTFELTDAGDNGDTVQIALTLPAGTDYYRTVTGYPPTESGEEITFWDDASITAVDGDKFTIRDPSAIVLNVFDYGGFDADTLADVYVRHLDVSNTTDGPDGTWTNELTFSATSIDHLVDLGAVAQASTASIVMDNAGSFFFTAELQAQEASASAELLLSGSSTVTMDVQAQEASAGLTLEMAQQIMAALQSQPSTATFTLFSQSREMVFEVQAQDATAGAKFRVPITWTFEPDNFKGS